MLVQVLDEKRSLAKPLDSGLRGYSGVRTQQCILAQCCPLTCPSTISYCSFEEPGPTEDSPQSESSVKNMPWPVTPSRTDFNAAGTAVFGRVCTCMLPREQTSEGL
jgi:hypothetical protein